MQALYDDQISMLFHNMGTLLSAPMKVGNQERRGQQEILEAKPHKSLSNESKATKLQNIKTRSHT